MGISLPGFPNMFFIYGPQAPTAFANGPTMAQYQSDWIVDFLIRARKEGFDRVEAKQEVEDEWVEKVHQAWNGKYSDMQDHSLSPRDLHRASLSTQTSPDSRHLLTSFSHLVPKGKRMVSRPWTMLSPVRSSATHLLLLRFPRSYADLIQ